MAPPQNALNRRGWPWPGAGKECDNIGGYSIIYADPPWQYQRSKVQGAAENHYPTMSIDELCALPVAEIAAPDSALFMWATFPQLPEALRLIKAWGFNYKSVAFVWLKKNKKADSWFYGLGFWTRGNAEICLLATRGHPKRQAADVHQFIISPIEAHSKSRTKRGIKFCPSWAICPGWSCSPVRPRPAGMYGVTRWSRRSGTSGQFVPRKECDGCPM